jgi:hypothetical protein
MAGYFAAHAIWCISGDGPLVPMYAYELPTGDRGMDRLVVNDSGEAQRVGRDALRANPHAADRAVLLYDAFINLDGVRRDAIIVEAHDYAMAVTFAVAVPYRPASTTDGFAVFAVHLLAQTGLTIARTAEVLEPFFTGVDAHEKGAGVWSSSLMK